MKFGFLHRDNAEAFYDGAVDRIMRSILLFGGLLIPAVWFRCGFLTTAGFVLGSIISYLNFRWLAAAIRALGTRIVEAQSSERGYGIVARFLLRYALIGFIAYATFVSWPVAFYGFLAGLCMPVAAMMAEAAFELVVSPHRTI
jgi:ATP synthase I chain